MSVFYDEMRAMVLDILTEFGTTATYNDGAADHTITACKLPKSKDSDDKGYFGMTVLTGQSQLAIYSTTTIVADNKITFGSTLYNIESVMKVEPDSDTVMYMVVIQD